MNRKQKQVMDSLVRVRAFLDAYPMTGSLSSASAREMLDDVVQRLRSYAGAQHSGRDGSRMELKRQEDQIALLLDEYIRPIVMIARAQIELGSDVGLPAGLRMPKLPLGPTKLIAVCDGMIEAARPHEKVFVANGLSADFLAQFASARDTLERVMGGRANQVGTKVAARAGLKVQLLRGRAQRGRLAGGARRGLSAGSSLDHEPKQRSECEALLAALSEPPKMRRRSNESARGDLNGGQRRKRRWPLFALAPQAPVSRRSGDFLPAASVGSSTPSSSAR